MISFEPQSNRDASDTIRGYVYQVNLTIKRWLSLKSGEILELECGEDIDLVSRSLPNLEQRMLEQVKNYTKSSVTLRSDVAVEAIANFIEHRQNNPELKSNIRFLYTTTASVGRERPLPKILNNKNGITVWEELRKNQLDGISQDQALQGIWEILNNKKQPKKLSNPTWNVFKKFIKNRNFDELLKAIIKFEWSTNSPQNEQIKKDILKPVAKYITFPLIFVLIVLALLNTDKLYTFYNFIFTASFLFIHWLIFRYQILGRFYIAYLVHLIPFFIVNGLLTYLPVVTYNNEENLGFRLGSIPIEDSIYSLLLLLMNITLYELFKKSDRKYKQNSPTKS